MSRSPIRVFSEMGETTRVFDPDGLRVVFRYLRGGNKTQGG